jgi:hypothetical protein
MTLAKRSRRIGWIVKPIYLAILASLMLCACRSEPVKFNVTSGDDAGFILPVAIVSLGGAEYLIANYDHVSILNTAIGSINRIIPDNIDYLNEFVPTSFAFDARSGRLLIANYTANNVIVATVDILHRSMHFDKLIGDEQTVSPEGVAISGDIVAVANYDGNSIQFFDQRRVQPNSICNVPVRQAHGVAFLGRYAYGTSLSDSTLIKIDPQTCSIVLKVGENGWGARQFLWPTSVAVWDDHSIVVSDAQTGLISVYDAETLGFVKSFGGNEPGQSALNMPYGLSVHGGDVFVTSTFGNGIARFKKASGAMVEKWGASENWAAIQDGSRYSLNSESRKGKVDTHTVVTIDGSCFHPGYAELVACDEDKNNIQMPEVSGSEMYFIQVAHNGDKMLIFSPQCSTALLITDGVWSSRREVDLGFDHWLVDGRVVGPQGDFRISATARN